MVLILSNAALLDRLPVQPAPAGYPMAQADKEPSASSSSVLCQAHVCCLCSGCATAHGLQRTSGRSAGQLGRPVVPGSLVEAIQVRIRPGGCRSAPSKGTSDQRPSSSGPVTSCTRRPAPDRVRRRVRDERSQPEPVGCSTWRLLDVAGRLAPPSAAPSVPGPPLSPRELDVLAQVALGCSNAETGRRLPLPPERPSRICAARCASSEPAPASRRWSPHVDRVCRLGSVQVGVSRDSRVPWGP